jgi:hypothetical protein
MPWKKRRVRARMGMWAVIAGGVEARADTRSRPCSRAKTSACRARQARVTNHRLTTGGRWTTLNIVERELDLAAVRTRPVTKLGVFVSTSSVSICYFMVILHKVGGLVACRCHRLYASCGALYSQTITSCVRAKRPRRWSIRNVATGTVFRSTALLKARALEYPRTRQSAVPPRSGPCVRTSESINGSTGIPTHSEFFILEKSRDLGSAYRTLSRHVAHGCGQILALLVD